MMDLARNDLLRLYQQMVLARALAAHVSPPASKLVGRYSNEAVTVGAAVALATDDIIMPQRHDLGAYLARGMSLEDVLARQMPSGDMRAQLVAPPGQDAGKALAIAAGMALGTQLRDEQRVTLVYADRTGAESADGYEALRFAALHHLPLVCVIAYPCLPQDDEVTLLAFADRIAAFGVPTTHIDGGDALAVYAAASTARESARGGAGPVAIVARLARLSTFGNIDHQDADVATAEQDDPIALLAAVLIARGVLTDEDCAAIADAAATSVTAALAQREQRAPATALHQDRAIFATESASPLGPPVPVTRVAVPVLSESGEHLL